KSNPSRKRSFGGGSRRSAKGESRVPSIRRTGCGRGPSTLRRGIAAFGRGVYGGAARSRRGGGGETRKISSNQAGLPSCESQTLPLPFCLPGINGRNPDNVGAASQARAKLRNGSSLKSSSMRAASAKRGRNATFHFGLIHDSARFLVRRDAVDDDNAKI